MKRLLVNGSPRGRESNSRLLLKWLSEGIASQGSAAGEIIDLAETKQLGQQHQAFLEAEEIILVLPLYTDSLPGLVKNFLDSLAASYAERLCGKRLGFVVQSGFPESIHSEALAAWLARLCSRLGFVNLGIVIKGGVEGIRIMPDSMTKKLKNDFVQLGSSLAAKGSFDPALIAKLARPRTLNKRTRFVMALLKPTGLMNFYWNSNLKQHDAWKERNARPYA